MKSNRRLLRLGSFEQLESRELLAHVGPPETFEERMFVSSPRMQPRDAEYSEFTQGSQHGGTNFAAYQTFADTRGGNEFLRDRSAHGNGGHMSFQNDWMATSRSKDSSANDTYQTSTPSLTTSSVWLAPATTTVIVFITIPAPEYSLPRVTSSLPVSTPNESSRNEPPRSSALVAPPGNFGEPFMSASSPARGSGAATRGDALTFTSLLLRKTDSESTSTAENDEQIAELTAEDHTDSTDEQQLAVQRADRATIQQSPDDADDEELIELGTPRKQLPELRL